MKNKKLIPVIAATTLMLALSACSQPVKENPEEGVAANPIEGQIPTFSLTEAEQYLLDAGYDTFNADNIITGQLGSCTISVSRDLFVASSIEPRDKETSAERLSELHIAGVVELAQGVQTTDVEKLEVERPSGEIYDYKLVEYNFDREGIPSKGINASYIPEGEFPNPYSDNEASIAMMQAQYSCDEPEYSKDFFVGFVNTIDIVMVDPDIIEAQESKEEQPTEESKNEENVVEEVANEEETVVESVETTEETEAENQ